MKYGALAILTATLALSCSGKESEGAPSNEGGIENDGGAGRPDTSADVASDASIERSADSASDASIERSVADRFVDIFDVFPLSDGPLGTCVGCIRDRCGTQVNDCANSPVCRAGLLCTLTTCVAAGGDAGPNLACVTGCFMGDLGAAFAAIGSFSCINTSCGAACTPGAIGAGGASDDASSTAPGDASDGARPGEASDTVDAASSFDGAGD